MTTIAARISKDRAAIAGDSQISDECGLKGSGMVKVFRLRSHLIGFAGNVDACHLFLEWFDNGADQKEGAALFSGHAHAESDFIALVINQRLEAYSLGKLLIPVPERSPLIAIGSGAGIALGAMAMGASPKKAVTVAKNFDLFTGGDVRTLSMRRCA